MTDRLHLETPEPTPGAAYAAHLAAERAWEAELDRLFGKRAGDVRYYEEGRGEPSSRLRELYDARDATLAAWERSKAQAKSQV